MSSGGYSLNCPYKLRGHQAKTWRNVMLSLGEFVQKRQGEASKKKGRTGPEKEGSQYFS